MTFKKMYLFLTVVLVGGSLSVYAATNGSYTNDGQLNVQAVIVRTWEPNSVKELIEYRQEKFTLLSLCKDKHESEVIYDEVKRNRGLKWFNEQAYSTRFRACLIYLAAKRDCTRNSTSEKMLSVVKEAARLVYDLQELVDAVGSVHRKVSLDSQWRTNYWGRSLETNMNQNQKFVQEVKDSQERAYTIIRGRLSDDYKLKQALEAARIIMMEL